MYKAKELTVNGEKAFFVIKGQRYFPTLKYVTLQEAQEQAIIENIHASYRQMRKYFEKLEKMNPEKYDENKGFNSEKYNLEDLLA